MAVTAKIYGKAYMHAFNKEIDWDTDTVYVALVAAAYTPDQDAHEAWSDVVANEITGTGYTANGKVLVTPTRAYTGATNRTVLDAVDPSWTVATFSARYAVFYNRTPATDATRWLISWVDFGVTESVTAGTFTLILDALGVMYTDAA